MKHIIMRGKNYNTKHVESIVFLLKLKNVDREIYVSGCVRCDLKT